MTGGKDEHTADHADGAEADQDAGSGFKFNLSAPSFVPGQYYEEEPVVVDEMSAIPHGGMMGYGMEGQYGYMAHAMHQGVMYDPMYGPAMGMGMMVPEHEMIHQQHHHHHHQNHYNNLNHNHNHNHHHNNHNQHNQHHNQHHNHHQSSHGNNHHGHHHQSSYSSNSSHHAASQQQQQQQLDLHSSQPDVEVGMTASDSEIIPQVGETQQDNQPDQSNVEPEQHEEFMEPTTKQQQTDKTAVDQQLVEDVQSDKLSGKESDKESVVTSTSSIGSSGEVHVFIEKYGSLTAKELDDMINGYNATIAEIEGVPSVSAPKTFNSVVRIPDWVELTSEEYFDIPCFDDDVDLYSDSNEGESEIDSELENESEIEQDENESQQQTGSVNPWARSSSGLSFAQVQIAKAAVTPAAPSSSSSTVSTGTSTTTLPVSKSQVKPEVETVTPIEEKLADPAVNLRKMMGYIADDCRPVHPRGLINNGNMCFMNAILQPLVHLVPFYKIFQYLKLKIPHSFDSKTPLIDSITIFISEFVQENVDAARQANTITTSTDSAGTTTTVNGVKKLKSNSFAPEYVYESLRKRRNMTSNKGRQEDAEEFFGFLLDGLDEEFTKEFQNSTLRTYKQFTLEVYEILRMVLTKKNLRKLFTNPTIKDQGKVETATKSIPPKETPAAPWAQVKSSGSKNKNSKLDQTSKESPDVDIFKNNTQSEVKNGNDSAISSSIQEDSQPTEPTKKDPEGTENDDEEDEDLSDVNVFINRMSQTTGISTPKSEQTSNLKTADESDKENQSLDVNISGNKFVSSEELRELFASKDLGSSNGDVDSQKGDGEEWTSIGSNNKVVSSRILAMNKSPITSLFCGNLQTTIKRSQKSGKGDSVNTEPFQTLQLDISTDDIETLEDAFYHFVEPEIIQLRESSSNSDVNSPSSSPPRAGGAFVISKNELAKQSLIDSLPPVMILHLKRFVYDIQENTTVKLTKFIRYPETLHISPDWLSENYKSSKDYVEFATPFNFVSVDNKTKEQKIKERLSIDYKLVAVINHHGKTAAGGHYNSHVRRLGANDWYRYDDDSIQQSTVSEVLSMNEDQHAYMLMYMKT